MGFIAYILALVCFIVATFDGHVGDLRLVPLGLSLFVLGHILDSQLPRLGRRSQP